MNMTTIKNKGQGFTIVELLIVVVVIAILAAITIVSYNGITNKANASAAKSTAATVQKKIELYNTQVGNYPITKDALTAANNSYTVDGSLFTGANEPTASGSYKGTGHVRVQACHTGTLSASTITGMRIRWYDYERSSSQIQNLDVGNCTGTIASLPNS